MVQMLSLREQLFHAPVLQKVALPVVSITTMMIFLFIGPAIFGVEVWARWEKVTLAFIILVIVAFVFELRKMEETAWKVLAIMSVTAVGSFFLFAFTSRGFKYESGFPLGGIVPTIIFQVFVITYAEEVFFRGFLVERLRVLPSAAVFSAFHLLAYSTAAGLNFTALGVAFVMGLALGFIYIATKKYASIGVTWGIHIGWNTALLFA